MKISELLEQDMIVERNYRATQYLNDCKLIRELSWKWWFRQLLGGVWQ